jgi:hypothetical protein
MIANVFIDMATAALTALKTALEGLGHIIGADTLSAAWGLCMSVNVWLPVTDAVAIAGIWVLLTLAAMTYKMAIKLIDWITSMIP